MFVQLEPFDLNNEAHIQLLYDVRSHLDVDRFLTGPKPENFEKHIQYLKHIPVGKKYYIIVADKNLCGYCQSTELKQEVELGWALHPNWWGKGIGKEAVALLLEEVKRMHKKIILFVKKDNSKAIAIYRKAGFVTKELVKERDEWLMEWVG